MGREVSPNKACENNMEYSNKIKEWKSKILAFDKIEGIADSFTSKILGIEKEILSIGIANYKKVPANTVTSRHEFYNLLDYDWEELNLVKNQIIKNASNIIGGNSFYVKMWANIFRHDEYIEKHIHHPEPVRETDEFKNNIFKTVCGHLFLKNDYPSNTTYYFENQKVDFLNVEGDMHVFCCIVPHEVKPFNGKIRVGIAFDVYSEDFFKELGIPIPNDVRLIK